MFTCGSLCHLPAAVLQAFVSVLVRVVGWCGGSDCKGRACPCSVKD